MSFFDYKVSQNISAEDPPFASLIMAAIRKADSMNAAKLMLTFPEISNELTQRHSSPGGWLPGEVATS